MIIFVFSHSSLSPAYLLACILACMEVTNRPLQKDFVIKVAPRVEKTEVFRKGWNLANRTYFASCIMRKHFFVLWTKERAFLPYFYLGIIFYSAELFDSAVNFKFYLNIFIFLKVVSATFLLVCILSLNESTCQTRKMFFISLQKLFSFLRKF